MHVSALLDVEFGHLDVFGVECGLSENYHQLKIELTCKSCAPCSPVMLICSLAMVKRDLIISTWLDASPVFCMRERLIAGLPVNILRVLKQFSGFIIFCIASIGWLRSSFDMSVVVLWF